METDIPATSADARSEVELEWKVFYTDTITSPVLKIVSSQECLPADVPGFGIVGVAVEDEQAGWRFHRSHDFYIFDKNMGWRGMDWIGFVDYVGNQTSPVTVKFGRNVPDSIWQEFIKVELPEKSAYHLGEKR